MIAGHLGLALGARAVDPDAPLGWLVAASLAPDVLDLGIAATGACNPDGVYTHSLAAIAATALVLGAAAAWRTRSGRTALVIAALVASHLLADYVTGLKALWVGGPVIGLNLYDTWWADFAVEAPLIVGGWWAARRWGRVPPWIGSRTLLAGLLGFQLLADVMPDRRETANPSVCAKAGLVDKLHQLF